MKCKIILPSVIFAFLFINTSCSQQKRPLNLTPIIFRGSHNRENLVGEKQVIYKAYLHILYVSNPVDTDYQSLNVYVPVSVNGSPINPSNALILLISR